MSLRQKIAQEIAERGPIPFSRYMEMCLYDAQLGYYSRETEKFGKAGDFYTSSDVHAVFGRLLTRQFEEMWRTLGSPESIELVEIGPGRGLFAQDVLDWSEKKFSDFHDALHYTLVESSPSLRQRLSARFHQRIDTSKVTLLPIIEVSPNEAGSEHSQSSTSESARCSADSKASTSGLKFAGRADEFERALSPEIPVIVFANEFFDALPVDVLSSLGSLRVDCPHDRFVETWAPASPQELEYLDRYGVHPEPDHRTEVCDAAIRCASRLAESIRHGFFVAIDYGYTRDEQLAGRHLGTVMGFRQHSVSPNPYEAPGEQDITAHVNFTALSAISELHGMRAHKLLTQSQFLMGIGEANQFGDAFEDCRLPQERAKVALQLKHLVTPAGMGETFHVLVASKGVDAAKVEKLSGLSFARGRG